VTWGGAILSPAAGTTSGAFVVGAALLGNTVSPDVARFSIASNFYAFVVSGALSGIALTGAAVVILRTDVFPRWLGWAGALVAVAAIVGSAAIMENDPAGLFAAVNGSRGSRISYGLLRWRCRLCSPEMPRRMRQPHERLTLSLLATLSRAIGARPQDSREPLSIESLPVSTSERVRPLGCWRVWNWRPKAYAFSKYPCRVV
jgi:hypothetical protein